MSLENIYILSQKITCRVQHFEVKVGSTTVKMKALWIKYFPPIEITCEVRSAHWTFQPLLFSRFTTVETRCWAAQQHLPQKVQGRPPSAWRWSPSRAGKDLPDLTQHPHFTIRKLWPKHFQWEPKLHSLADLATHLVFHSLARLGSAKSKPESGFPTTKADFPPGILEINPDISWSARTPGSFIAFVVCGPLSVSHISVKPQLCWLKLIKH